MWGARRPGDSTSNEGVETVRVPTADPAEYRRPAISCRRRQAAPLPLVSTTSRRQLCHPMAIYEAPPLAICCPWSRSPEAWESQDLGGIRSRLRWPCPRGYPHSPPAGLPNSCRVTGGRSSDSPQLSGLAAAMLGETLEPIRTQALVSPSSARNSGRSTGAAAAKTRPLRLRPATARRREQHRLD